jgi:hypothetical protein
LWNDGNTTCDDDRDGDAKAMTYRPTSFSRDGSWKAAAVIAVAAVASRATTTTVVDATGRTVVVLLPPLHLAMAIPRFFIYITRDV